MNEIFLEITVIICLSVALAFVFKSLKQSPILAYLLAGVILGPFALFRINDGRELVSLMGELGVTLLLFMLGLELKFSELKSVGKVALVAGLAQIFLTSLLGFGLSFLLGFSVVSSLYIAIAVTFSSTIIIVKLLSDKKDLNSLYGKIAVGILLVQDLFAIIALVVLSGFKGEQASLGVIDFVLVLVKVGLLFGIVIFLSRTLLPKIIDYVSSSHELLFLFSLAWAFGVATIVSSPWVGFSVEIGGFLAGLSLANSSENFQIIARIRPLRDFFITIFFVSLGMGMVFVGIEKILLPALIIALYVLVGGPLIVMAILGLMGYSRRISFFSGILLAQVSEFSLILVFIGNKLGHIPSETASTITLVAVITFVVSTYMIMHDNAIYKKLHRYLHIFERKHRLKVMTNLGELKDHIILIGANRTGLSILDALEKNDNTFVVVDFNPDVINELEEKNVSSLFGDIADPDIQEKAFLDTAKMIISTVPDLKDNLVLLDSLEKQNRRAKVIVFAQTAEDEAVLYENGADYVVVPHLSGGQHVAHIIEHNNLDTIKFTRLRKNPPMI